VSVDVAAKIREQALLSDAAEELDKLNHGIGVLG
jgi:hypothetical protein